MTPAPAPQVCVKVALSLLGQELGRLEGYKSAAEAESNPHCVEPIPSGHCMLVSPGA